MSRIFMRIFINNGFMHVVRKCARKFTVKHILAVVIGVAVVACLTVATEVRNALASTTQEPFEKKHIDDVQNRAKAAVEKARAGNDDAKAKEFMEQNRTEIANNKEPGKRLHLWLRNEDSKELRKKQDHKDDWRADSQAVVGNKDIKDAQDVAQGKLPDAHQNVSEKTFMECFEPLQYPDKRCPYCQTPNPPHCKKDEVAPYPGCKCYDNKGETWEYWWPEYEVEVNAFGVSAFSPFESDPKREDLVRAELFKKIKEELTKSNPNKGVEDHNEDVAKNILKDKNATTTDDVKQKTQDAVKKIKEKMNDLDKFGGGQFECNAEGTHAHIYRTEVTNKNQTSTKRRDEKNNIHNQYCYWTQTLFGCVPPCQPSPNACCLPKHILVAWNGYDYKKGGGGGEFVNRDCFFDTLPPSEDTKPKEDEQILGLTEETGTNNKSFAKGVGKLKETIYGIWTMPQWARKFEKDTRVDYLQNTGQTQFDPKKRPYDDPKKLTQQDTKLLFTQGGTNQANPNDPFGTMTKQTHKTIFSETGGFAVGHLDGGSHLGTVTSPIGATLIARKAYEMFAEIGEMKKPRNTRPIMKRIFKYTDKVDKIQMVYPKMSKCFKTGTLNENKPFVTTSKPPLTNPFQLGSIRFIIWNKRTACTCPFTSHFRDGNSLPYGVRAWGCQPMRHPDYAIGDGDEKDGDIVRGSKKLDPEFNEPDRPKEFGGPILHFVYRLYGMGNDDNKYFGMKRSQ